MKAVIGKKIYPSGLILDEEMMKKNDLNIQPKKGGRVNDRI